MWAYAILKIREARLSGDRHREMHAFQLAAMHRASFAAYASDFATGRAKLMEPANLSDTLSIPSDPHTDTRARMQAEANEVMRLVRARVPTIEGNPIKQKEAA